MIAQLVNTETVIAALLLAAAAGAWRVLGTERIITAAKILGLVALGAAAGVGGTAFAVLKGWMNVSLG